MNYLQVVKWLVKDILDTTDAQGDIEANVDRYLEDLSKDVQQQAEALGKEQFRLLCATNTPRMKGKVKRLAQKFFKGRYKPNSLDVFFEHDQWHVRFDSKDGALTCTVVDAEPGQFNSGLDFEEIDFVEI